MAFMRVPDLSEECMTTQTIWWIKCHLTIVCHRNKNRHLKNDEDLWTCMYVCIKLASVQLVVSISAVGINSVRAEAYCCRLVGIIEIRLDAQNGFCLILKRGRFALPLQQFSEKLLNMRLKALFANGKISWHANGSSSRAPRGFCVCSEWHTRCKLKTKTPVYRAHEFLIMGSSLHTCRYLVQWLNRLFW